MSVDAEVYPDEEQGNVKRDSEQTLVNPNGPPAASRRTISREKYKPKKRVILFHFVVMLLIAIVCFGKPNGVAAIVKDTSKNTYIGLLRE